MSSTTSSSVTTTGEYLIQAIGNNAPMRIGDVRRITHCHDWLLTYTYHNHPNNCSMYQQTVSDYLSRVEHIDRVLGRKDLETHQMRIRRLLSRMYYDESISNKIHSRFIIAFDAEEYLEKIQTFDQYMEFLYERK